LGFDWIDHFPLAYAGPVAPKATITTSKPVAATVSKGDRRIPKPRRTFIPESPFRHGDPSRQWRILMR
jgi:hypothetical protein